MVCTPADNLTRRSFSLTSGLPSNQTPPSHKLPWDENRGGRYSRGILWNGGTCSSKSWGSEKHQHLRNRRGATPGLASCDGHQNSKFKICTENNALLVTVLGKCGLMSARRRLFCYILTRIGLSYSHSVTVRVTRLKHYPAGLKGLKPARRARL